MNNYEKLLYKSNRQKHQLKILQDKCHKYKEVLDKLKEYIENDILNIYEEVGIGPMVYDKLNELLEEIE